MPRATASPRGSPTVTLGLTPGGATLGGNTATASNGLATFSDADGEHGGHLLAHRLVHRPHRHHEQRLRGDGTTGDAARLRATADHRHGRRRPSRRPITVELQNDAGGRVTTSGVNITIALGSKPWLEYAGWHPHQGNGERRRDVRRPYARQDRHRIHFDGKRGSGRAGPRHELGLQHPAGRPCKPACACHSRARTHARPAVHSRRPRRSRSWMRTQPGHQRHRIRGRRDRGARGRSRQRPERNPKRARR